MIPAFANFGREPTPVNFLSRKLEVNTNEFLPPITVEWKERLDILRLAIVHALDEANRQQARGYNRAYLHVIFGNGDLVER